MKLSRYVVIVLALSGVLFFGYFQTGDSQNTGSTGEAAAPEAVISLNDILSNPELIERSKTAVSSADLDELRSLQAKALEIADAGGVPAEQRHVLEGERGLDYLAFVAKRRLFIDEFETRFKNLQPITSLKLAYPEAKDLFSRADQLIEKRDETILQIAELLAEGTPDKHHIEEARKAWRARAATDNTPVLD